MAEMTDLLIVGGGLNGPALGLAAATAGLSAQVIDASPAQLLEAPDFDGRAYAISASSRGMLRALGLWEGLADHAQPMLDIKVSDGQAGQGAAPFHLHFDHREIGVEPMGHMLEDRYLRAALIKAAETAGVAMTFGAAVVTQDIGPSGVTVTLADGSTRTARLLVGADGRTSETAARAGIRRTGWAYDQTSLVTALTVERDHLGCAHQMFFPEGPLAVLPLQGNRVSIVWTEQAERAAQIMSLDDAAYLDVLRPRFGSFLGEITLTGRRYSYPLGLSLAEQLVGDRLVLVGDAAHGIHPLAGQGLNLGLRDVAALAQVLAGAARRGEDIASPLVLERYRRWRQSDIAALALATDGINRVFSNANPLLRAGRVLALGALDALPGPRRALIRAAAGLSGEMPRLLKGEPL